MSGIQLKDVISFASLGLTIFFGAMWLGALDNSVNTLKATAVTDGRIARLEQRVDTLNENTRELKVSVQELVRELKRQP